MNETSWWHAKKGEVHATVIDYVRSVDQSQGYIYNRFVRLEALYDTERASGRSTSMIDPRTGRVRKIDARMIENLIAQNVDTIAAQIATTDVRATFDTDGADWSEQRRARHREWYTEEIIKDLDVVAKAAHAFKIGTALKGTGAIKVGVDRFDQIRVDHVPPDNIVVDERECSDGNEPLQMHVRGPRDSEEMASMFPKFRRQIEAARGDWRPRWAGWLPVERSEVMVIESWRLPIGPVDHDAHVPGRHAITIVGCDLLDEPWHKPFFPVATNRWSKPPRGWFGIGMAEQISGHQRALNKANAQIDRQADHNSNPIIMARPQDRHLAVQTVNDIGTIAVYNGATPPQVTFGQEVSPFALARRQDIKSSSFEQTGQSRITTQGVKPPGIETGIALREYKEQTSGRFATQEKDFERFILEIIVLILDCCRDLGGKAPEMTQRSRFGRRRLSWRNVEANDIRRQIGAASTLSRTRAGRLQTVLELAQAGIIAQDEARRLIRHPDLEREMSLYTAAIESCDELLEEIADGNVVVPEPFMNLKMLVWRGQQQYLIWRSRKAPEEILESLRQVIVQAAWLDAQASKASSQPAPGPSSADIIGQPPGLPPPGAQPGAAPAPAVAAPPS